MPESCIQLEVSGLGLSNHDHWFAVEVAFQFADSGQGVLPEQDQQLVPSKKKLLQSPETVCCRDEPDGLDADAGRFSGKGPMNFRGRACFLRYGEAHQNA